MTEYTKLIELVVNDITRVITIPNNNIVLGVVGDIEVNKLMFKMPRYYCGFDMSEFTPKINYVTPNAEGNYYKSELEVTDDVITFTWLLTSDVTEHNGTVKFSISLYKKENGRVSKVFNSRSSVGNVLEGLNVDAYVTPEQQQTILDRLETEIREDIQSFVTEKEASINQQITEKSDAAIKAIDAKKNDVLSTISEDQYIQKIEQNAANVGSLREDLETKADNAEFNATLEELTAEVMYSRNVFDDSEYIGDTMPDYTQVNQKNFYGNFKYLKLGTPYFVQVEYTDGTKGNAQLCWQYIYADDTYSSLKSLGVSNIAEKDVKCFSINRTTGYQNTDDGKQIAHVWMTSGSNAYEPYKVSVKSKRLENLEKDIGNAMLSSNYMVQKNLLTDENITDNLQIQPFGAVADENCCSAYIPVKTGQTLYANYPLGTFVAWLCKADKTKISWVTINYSNEGASRNTGYTVETEDVEYIRLYWNKTRSGHHAYGTSTFDLFFSTEPIRFKCADKQFDESYIPEFNTGRLNNWWYLKSGDSLGDSLTGQGFFQSWAKKYFGLKSFENHGVGGSKLSGDDIDSSRLSMWKDERINALNADADFITVLGGQNDGNITIGEITKTNYDIYTYVGALNTIIDKIYDHCKQGVIIILCTPFYVPLEGDNGERFKILGDAVRELSKLRGLPVADFGGLCTADKKTADLYWGTDRTHPNENFYRDKIAPILISTMESIKPINWENVNYYD